MPVVNLFSNFLNPGWAEPCNEVKTFAERWQLLPGNRWLGVHAVLASILDLSYYKKNALTGLNPAGHGHFENRSSLDFFSFSR